MEPTAPMPDRYFVTSIHGSKLHASIEHSKVVSNYQGSIEKMKSKIISFMAID
jgi:hypothetical protein